nr:thioredoxin family protein [Variovorax boronicumulans]
MAGWPMQGALAASPGLKDYGRAPEFVGIEKWLNSGPLTMQGLAGKVVLVDFWTYTCINCIRTLPHVVRWYETYKDQGFVVVGVHSPEFAYERSTRNVQDAIERFDIRYPVAQDNGFTTWKAYNNQYWPAFYLVDAKGQVMRQHFGEGEYAEMEAVIQALLARKAAG